MLKENLNYNLLIACIIFIVASLTDWLDGRLARKYNQITTFGKFLDPIADKLLIVAAYLGFSQLGFSVWIPMIVVARELVVSSVRMIAGSSGTILAANIWGKVKTASQMIAVIISLFLIESNDVGIISSVVNVSLIVNIVLWITAILTLISGVQYVWQYRKHINMV